MGEWDEFVSLEIEYLLKIKTSRTSIRLNCPIMENVQLKAGSNIQKYDLKKYW